jgi:hypothetical protein
MDSHVINAKVRGEVNKTKILNTLLDNVKGIFYRGSIIYGTYEEGVSDIDTLVVVDDSMLHLLSTFPYTTFQYELNNVDFQVITETHFMDMIDANDIVAIECLSTNNNEWVEFYEKCRNHFKLDKWKLRQSVSGICSNSWVKCKKKLTVEKDYNLRIAQKSLWHSMRLYMFGIQVAKYGKITDFTEANYLWDEIKNAETPTWDYYNSKYKDKFNNLRSELVKLCDKPLENL